MKKSVKKINWHLRRTSKREFAALDKTNSQYSKCGEIFGRTHNLKRHFDRKHRWFKLNNPHNGKCVYFAMQEKDSTR